jgi:hypothetical protein
MEGSKLHYHACKIKFREPHRDGLLSYYNFCFSTDSFKTAPCAISTALVPPYYSKPSKLYSSLCDHGTGSTSLVTSSFN